MSISALQHSIVVTNHKLPMPHEDNLHPLHLQDAQFLGAGRIQRVTVAHDSLVEELTPQFRVFQVSQSAQHLVLKVLSEGPFFSHELQLQPQCRLQSCHCHWSWQPEVTPYRARGLTLKVNVTSAGCQIPLGGGLLASLV